MTIQQLIDWFNSNPYLVLIYFTVILALAIISVLIVTINNVNVIKYVMSAIIYGVTVPGILAVTLILYSLFIIKVNLLNVSFISYFVPIIFTIATLFVLNRKVKMSTIPGFSRLSALMIFILITFGIIFVLQRTYFGVLFIGGFSQLLIVFVIVFIVLKIAWSKLTK